MPYQDKFTFVQDYQIIGVNEGNKSFSFYIDKRFPLTANRITSSKNYGFDIEDNKENVFLYFDNYHYFDIIDNVEYMMSKFSYIKSPSLDEIFEIDKEVRIATKERINQN